MTGSEPGIQAAPDELLALAAAVRPAWDHDILAAAVTAAKNAGWTWDRTLAETVRLIRDPDGSPWDLKRAAADPFVRATVPPGTEKRGAAMARNRLETPLVACKHCSRAIVPCDSAPSHGGCSSAHGYIHAASHAHGCQSRSDGPYAAPSEACVREAS